MMRELLIRGMVAGLIAGLLTFGIGKVFGEPQVDQAIAFEKAHSHHEASTAPAGASGGQSMAGMPGMQSEAEGAPDSADVELVSRKMQASYGLLTATVVYGAGMGGLFALAFAFLYGRVGDLGPRLLALLLALAGFAAVYYVPSLKYPANPPAIGEPATIAYRTGLYFLMMLVSLGGMVFAVATARRLVERYGGLDAFLIGAAIFAAIIVVAQIVLPDINEVPPDFSATVLWKFRLASLGMQAILWGSLGLIFGVLAERVLAPETRFAPSVLSSR